MSLINAAIKPFKAWRDTSDTVRKLQYPMVGDPIPVLSRNFEVLIESGGIADRGTLVVDPLGKIHIIKITAGGVARDATELPRKVKAAQYVAAHEFV